MGGKGRRERARGSEARKRVRGNGRKEKDRQNHPPMHWQRAKQVGERVVAYRRIYLYSVEAQLWADLLPLCGQRGVSPETVVRLQEKRARERMRDRDGT